MSAVFGGSGLIETATQADVDALAEAHDRIRHGYRSPSSCFYGAESMLQNGLTVGPGWWNKPMTEADKAAIERAIIMKYGAKIIRYPIINGIATI